MSFGRSHRSRLRSSRAFVRATTESFPKSTKSLVLKWGCRGSPMHLPARANSNRMTTQPPRPLCQTDMLCCDRHRHLRTHQQRIPVHVAKSFKRSNRGIVHSRARRIVQAWEKLRVMEATRRHQIEASNAVEDDVRWILSVPTSSSITIKHNWESSVEWTNRNRRKIFNLDLSHLSKRTRCGRPRP